MLLLCRFAGYCHLLAVRLACGIARTRYSIVICFCVVRSVCCHVHRSVQGSINRIIHSFITICKFVRPGGIFVCV